LNQPDPSILSLDENRGALSAHGYRLILLHPETLLEIHTALTEKIGLEAGQIIFRGGYVIGLREARRLKEAGMQEEEVVRSVGKRCSAHGWGIFHIETLDVWRHELTFKVEHSPFAYAYGKSATGVDHLIRGVFSGVCEVVFEKKVVATESMCRAMGDPFCQFMVG
jgi:predicted hydrocarbon binding protein